MANHQRIVHGAAHRFIHLAGLGKNLSPDSIANIHERAPFGFDIKQIHRQLRASLIHLRRGLILLQQRLIGLLRTFQKCAVKRIKRIQHAQHEGRRQQRFATQLRLYLALIHRAEKKPDL